MKTVTCTLCDRTEDNPKVEGLQPDMPRRWSVLTIAEAGWQVQNFRLCPPCTQTVRNAIGRVRRATTAVTS